MRKALIIAGVLSVISAFSLTLMQEFEQPSLASVKVSQVSTHVSTVLQDTSRNEEKPVEVDTTLSTVVTPQSVVASFAQVGDEYQLKSPTERELVFLCPFSEEKGRTIIDFTENGTIPLENLELRADASIHEAKRTIKNVVLPKGNYSLQVATFRSFENMHEENNFDERWFVMLNSGNDDPIFTSHATRDMRTDEEQTIEQVEKEFVLNGVAQSVVYKHSAYPSDKPQNIVPLCVAFDKIDTLETHVAEEELVSSSNNGITTRTTVVIPGTDTKSFSETVQTLSDHDVEKKEILEYMERTDTEKEVSVHTQPSLEEQFLLPVNYQTISANVITAHPISKNNALELILLLSLVIALGVSTWFFYQEERV